jgi:hypothetical protein
MDHGDFAASPMSLPWNLYRVVCDTASGVASAEPHGAPRWCLEH